MEYQALNVFSNEIRLLTIDPAEDHAADITCSLKNVSLDRLPSYTALSYCWGSVRGSREVTINGKRFVATPNLYSALLNLRSKGVGSLWVDAICINQHDLEEKGRQVQLMGPIYQRAQEVAVWAGPEDEESADLIALIDRYGADQDDVKEAEVSSVPMDNFLGREYWTRVWIVQEIVLARSVVIHLGEQTLEWKRFAKAVTDMMKKMSADSGANVEVYENAKNLIDMRHTITERQDGRLITLAHALRLTSAAQATQSRDKIFGVLSLTLDGRDFVAAPMYQGTVQDVCQRMTLDYIAIKRNLDIVALLGVGCRAPKGCPSWCPQFYKLDGNTHYRQLTILGREPLQRNASSLFHIRPAAAGTTSAQVTYRDGALVCRALRLGEIVTVGQSIGDDSFVQPPSPATKGEKIPNPYRSAIDVFQAILDTLTYGVGMNKAKTAFMAHFDSLAYQTETLRTWRRSGYHPGFTERTAEWVDGQRQFRLHGRTIQGWCQWKSWTLRGLRARTVSAGERQGNMQALVDQMYGPDLSNVINTGQRFMITDKGYFGWAPELARQGDSIYLLMGCNFPVALRARDEGGVTLVGDVFIPKLMSGEAVKDDGSTDWNEIEIY